MEKVNTVKDTILKALNVEGFIKKNCRGLYARRMRKRKFREQKEKLREERWENKEKQKRQLASVTVEDSSAPPAGRVAKKKLTENDDSSDSEVDLGPLNEGYNKRST